MSATKQENELSPSDMCIWRTRVNELDNTFVYILAAEDDRQRSKVRSWVLSFDNSIAEDQGFLDAIVSFVQSVRQKALQQLCAEFIHLRNRNTAQIRDIHRAARYIEKEFVKIVECGDSDAHHA